MSPSKVKVLMGEAPACNAIAAVPDVDFIAPWYYGVLRE
jgi:hypothetical protein